MLSQRTLAHYRTPTHLSLSVSACYQEKYMDLVFTIAGPFSDEDMRDPGALAHIIRDLAIARISLGDSGIFSLADGVARGRIVIAAPYPRLSDIRPAKPPSAYHQRKAERTRIYQAAVDKKTARVKSEMAATRDEAHPPLTLEAMGVVPRSSAVYAANAALPNIVRASSAPGNSEHVIDWIQDKFAEAVATPDDRTRTCDDGWIRSDSGNIQIGIIRDNHTQELAYRQINEMRGQLSVLRTVATDAAIDVMLAHLLELTRLIKLTEKK